MEPAWVRRLEKRLGFIAIPNLSPFLVGMNCLVGLMSLFKPQFPGQLNLDPALVWSGQFWRLFTYIFIPPPMSPLWLFLWLIVIYFFIHALEKTWGDFPFTFFCCLGGATAATGALILDQPTGNSLFFTGLFLAFARLNPEMEVLLFFVLPVRMKWLAVITWFFLATQALFGGLVQLATIAAGLGHYLAFFGQFHWAELKHLWRQSRR